MSAQDKIKTMAALYEGELYMKTQIKPGHGTFRAGSGLFMVAATAAAVGLGAFWQWPYLAGEQGGGTFLLLYLLCVLLVGVPLLMAGLLVGRQGGAGVVSALRNSAEQSKTTRRWGLAGYPALLCALLLLVLVAVPANGALQALWALAQGMPGAPAATDAGQWLAAGSAAGWLALFLVPLAVVLAVGGRTLCGVSWLLSLLLLALIVVLAVCVASAPGFAAALAAVLHFGPFSWPALLAALNLAVLTLGLGVAGAVLYGGAGERRQASLAPAALAVGLLSVLAALVLLAVLGAPLAAPMAAAAPSTTAAVLPAGAAWLFAALPEALARLPMGPLAVAALFAFVVVGGWCAVLTLGESLVAWLIQAGLRRWLAASLVVLVAWLLAVALVTAGTDQALLVATGHYTIHALLPLAVLLLAVFAGWVIKETQARKGLAMKQFAVYLAWRAAVRILLPLAMLALLVAAALGVN